MSVLFIDTSGWAAFLISSDPFHEAATLLLQEHRKRGRSVLTTNYVMAELVALLTSPIRLSRPEQVRIIATLRSASWVHIVHIDPSQDKASWDLLASHDDKTWSLVDCASFVVMRDRSIAAALTNDRHFEQAGFIRLLKHR